MPSTREIRSRVKSIKNTMQITKAMQMVAAAKMKKSQEQAKSIEEYAQGLYEIVNKIGNPPENYSNPFLRKSSEMKNIGLIIFGPSKGFCGNLKTSLAIKLHQFISNFPRSNVDFKLITVNKGGHKIALKLNKNIIASFEDSYKIPNISHIESEYKLVEDLFAKGELDEVYIAYPLFKTTLLQVPVIRKILPLSVENVFREAHEEQSESKSSSDLIFEPDTAGILDELLPQYLRVQMFNALLMLVASEYSARMVAMKSATDNAKDLVSKLTLVYNRVRQSSITNEIIEVSTGAVAV